MLLVLVSAHRADERVVQRDDTNFHRLLQSVLYYGGAVCNFGRSVAIPPNGSIWLIGIYFFRPMDGLLLERQERSGPLNTGIFPCEILKRFHHSSTPAEAIFLPPQMTQREHGQPLRCLSVNLRRCRLHLTSCASLHPRSHL